MSLCLTDDSSSHYKDQPVNDVHGNQHGLYREAHETHTHTHTYRNIILRVVLYGYETWSLIMGEKRSLRAFENRLLRIFGPKTDEVTGEWRKLGAQ